MARLSTALLILALTASAPAAAFDGGTRLSLGHGPEVGTASLRLDFGLGGPVALGPAVEPVPDGFHLIPGGHGRKALGGFLVADLGGGASLAGLVSGAEDGGRAEVSATYAFGDTHLIMRLGGEWSADAALSDTAYQDGIDISLTLRHDLTSGLYVAGTASASATAETHGTADRGGLMVGASIGLRF